MFSAPAKQWTFNSGLDFNFDRLNSISRSSGQEDNVIQYSRGLYPDDARAWNMALFSLHQFTLERFVVNTGIRYNRFHIAATDTIFGNTFLTPSALVGNIGLSYKINQQIRLFFWTFNFPMESASASLIN